MTIKEWKLQLGIRLNDVKGFNDTFEYGKTSKVILEIEEVE